MLLLHIVLIVPSVLIGYLAQVTGLCLVRGVSDWRRAKRVRLVAILTSGFWIYLYLPLIPLLYGQNKLLGYDAHWSFIAGGFIFGLGAGFNSACSISTATRLASGDMKMLFTMVGWLIGWLLFEYSGIHFQYTSQNNDNSPWQWLILGTLFCVSLVVYFRFRHHWRLWGGITIVGILAGFVFLLQPAWSPSDFIRDTGLAIVHSDSNHLPSLDRVLILMGIIFGMVMGAVRYRRFRWALPDMSALIKHFPAGVLMGLGSALALGGNDFQLLLGLPGLSAAALGATASMLLGIAVVLRAKAIKLSEPE